VFEHVTILLSFVYAIALTHLLSSATELVLAHKRVRFSTALKHWSVLEVAIQFAGAIVQYFTCSTLRISEGRDGEIDLPALYQERRPIIFSAFLALTAIAAFENWWDRNNVVVPGVFNWLYTDLLIVPMALSMGVAGWARSRWLQWTAVVAQTALMVFFFVADGMLAGS